MPEQDQSQPKVGKTEPGEKDGYRTDTFSRGDAEGVPAEDAGEPDAVTGAEPIVEAGAEGGYQTDAFSRGDEEGVPQEDLRKPAPPEGGVR
jgi:hypothetical protein